MLCGAVVAMSMTMASCSGIEDNVVVPPVEPEETEQYVIEVEDGMTMPENDFLKVPAVAGDPNVINALKAIDRVTDVKAFDLEERWDYYNEKLITKTAYYFNYKQDIDHNNPSKGWFKQQCVLTVAGQDHPTVLHTEGYALNNTKTVCKKLVNRCLCLCLTQTVFRWNIAITVGRCLRDTPISGTI